MIRNCWHESGKQALHMHSQESESAILQLYQHRASETDHGMENIVCDLLRQLVKLRQISQLQWARDPMSSLICQWPIMQHSVFLGPQLSPQFSSLRIFWKSKILIVYPFGDWSDVRLLLKFCLIYCEHPHHWLLKFNYWVLLQMLLEVLLNEWCMHQITFPKILSFLYSENLYCLEGLQ